VYGTFSTASFGVDMLITRRVI